jgi:hypothetical protein
MARDLARGLVSRTRTTFIAYVGLQTDIHVFIDEYPAWSAEEP